MVASGQTKQFFCRNTETETRPLQKAEISAETEIAETDFFGQNTLFRPYNAVLAVDFTLKCAAKFGQNKVIRPKQAVSAETPKMEKTEIPKPKPKQAEIFGRNRTETVSV